MFGIAVANVLVSTKKHSVSIKRFKIFHFQLSFWETRHSPLLAETSGKPKPEQVEDNGTSQVQVHSGRQG